MDKITNEIISSGENSKLNKSRVQGATLFLPKHVEQILRHRENEDLHLLQRILLCGSVEVRCHYSCIDNVDNRYVSISAGSAQVRVDHGAGQGGAGQRVRPQPGGGLQELQPLPPGHQRQGGREAGGTVAQCTVGYDPEKNVTIQF